VEAFFLQSYKDLSENSIILFWFLKNNPSLIAPIKTPNANELDSKPETQKFRFNFNE